MIKVNGEMKPFDGMTAAELLAELNIPENRVAVELNGAILPRSEYGSAILRDGDSVELVTFVGGV